MTIWMVFVRIKHAGSTIVRYIDSQWADNYAAYTRAADLETSIRAFGYQIDGVTTGASVEVLKTSVTDAEIVKPLKMPPEAKPEPPLLTEQEQAIANELPWRQG